MMQNTASIAAQAYRNKLAEYPHKVKVEVWASTTKPKAYRHDLPFSRGGTSLTAANVRIFVHEDATSKSQIKFLQFRRFSFLKKNSSRVDPETGSKNKLTNIKSS